MVDEYKNEILINFGDGYFLKRELDDKNNIKGGNYGYAYVEEIYTKPKNLGDCLLLIMHQNGELDLSLEKQKEILEDLLNQLQTNPLTANFVKRYDFRIGFHDNHKKFNLDEHLDEQEIDEFDFEKQMIYSMLSWQRYEIWHNATSEELADFCENILFKLKLQFVAHDGLVFDYSFDNSS